MDLDIDFVRNQFPAFSENSLRDKAFFENAGGSYACGQVINRLNRFYMKRKYSLMAPLRPVFLVVTKWMKLGLGSRAIWVLKSVK